MDNPYRKKLYDAIRAIGYRHSVWGVFSDFLELCSISISNMVDIRPEVSNKREETYLETISKYSKEDQECFAKMFADLAMALRYEVKNSDAPRDVLGCLFHDLELHNKYRGQFFTPQNVCDMMAKMTFGSGESYFKDKDFISLSEPTCGSGAMILGMATAMADAGVDYRTKLVVEAIDVDLKCVYMCYLQLSLYGIPAIVIHGNGLTFEEWSRWYTPTYIIDNWNGKRQRTEKIKTAEEL